MEATLTIKGSIEDLKSFLDREALGMESELEQGQFNLEVQTESGEEDTEYDREDIKRELTELKIPFNKKSHTETLARTLEVAKDLVEENKHNTAKVLKESIQEAANEQAEEKKDYTLEEAREALKKYAIANGTDKAKEVLEKLGAKKLSDITDYNILMKKLEG